MQARIKYYYAYTFAADDHVRLGLKSACKTAALTPYFSQNSAICEETKVKVLWSSSVLGLCRGHLRNES